MSTGYDAAFTLPEPEFLWIHDLMLVDQAASVVTDAATGRWTYANVGASVGFTGYIASVGRGEFQRAASVGIRADAVALIPHSVPVDVLNAETFTLNCGPDSKASRWLWGEYEITQARPNPSHVRAILTRIVGEKTPHAP